MTRFMTANFALLLLGGFAHACDTCGHTGTCTVPKKAAGWAEQPAKPADPVKLPVPTAAEKAKYRETAEAVWARLMKSVKLIPGENWPADLDTTVVFKVVDTIPLGKGASRYNAVANRLVDEETDTAVKKNGKYVPLVRITYGYIALFGGDENTIALVLGHELGHHALGHTAGGAPFISKAQELTDGHRREADADLYGARLVRAARFSLAQAVRTKWKGMDAHEMNYSGVEGTCASHPGTTDRVARLLAVLEKGDEQLWRTMAAFENGATFLETHNYLLAEQFFLRVTKEFPTCHEAWANLGVARLMRYCQGLSAEAVQKLGVGHFLNTTHYRTARSLLTRTDKVTLWQEAVDALKTANDLKGREPLVMLNLGLAYLLHPAGKDVGTALEYLTAAEKAFDASTDLPNGARLALLINFGVAAIADNDLAKGRARLKQAEEFAQKLYRADRREWPEAVRGAFAFNAATAATDNDAAVELYEEYLSLAPVTNAWWPIAYERYRSLCESLNRRAIPKERLKKEPRLASRLAVNVPGVGIIHAGQDIDEAIAKLGKPTRETKEKSSIRRLAFEKHGIELLADCDEVFAVVIVAANGLTVEVREGGIHGKKLGELKVGMTRAEVEALIGQGENAYLFFLTKKYPYYGDLCAAVHYDENGKVVKLTLGQFPVDPNDK